MPSPDVVAAVQSSEDWIVIAAPTVLARTSRAIRVTAAPAAGATLEVTKTDGTEGASTGVLGLHVLEPIAVKAVTDLGDATEVRVYF